MLSYAGYLQGLDLAQLESQILREHLGAAGSVLGAVLDDERQDVVDPEAFHDGISRSLADGGFRLVIVLDSAPDELIQVVGYLQMVTEKIDVDLVTVTADEVNGSRVLVPQRIEPARRTREMSDAAVNARQSGTQTEGSRDFRGAIDQAPPEFRDDLARLTEWAESLEAEGLARLATRSGISGLTSLKPLLHSGGVALVTITCDLRSSYMQFFRSVFERRAPEAIPAVEAALGAKISQGNSTRAFTEQLLTCPFTGWPFVRPAVAGGYERPKGRGSEIYGGWGSRLRPVWAGIPSMSSGRYWPRCFTVRGRSAGVIA